MLLRTTHEIRTHAAFRVKRFACELVFSQLHRANQPHAAHVADQRMISKLLQPRLKRGRHAANVADDVALFVNL